MPVKVTHVTCMWRWYMWYVYQSDTCQVC